MQMDIVNGPEQLILKEIKSEMKLPDSQFIDLYKGLGGEGLTKGFLFMDKAHCNDDGYHVIA
jgi:hypothetical protein